MRKRIGVSALVVAAVVLAGCGGGDESTSTATTVDPAAPIDAELTVLGEDVKFPESTYAVDAGVIEITYENVGNVLHSLVIEDVDGFKLVVKSKGDVDTGLVDLEPGTYEMFCDIPGHQAAGMEATLEVG